MGRQIICQPITDNFTKRTQPIRQIIIHAMGEYLEIGKDCHLHATTFFQENKLSCDYMITPGGDTLQCNLDPLNKYTWHAKGFNEDSLGIEVLVPGLWSYPDFEEAIQKDNWVTDSAFSQVIDLVVNLCRVHNLTAQDIYPHSARDNRGIKHDPGNGFGWKNFITHVSSRLY